MSANAKDLISKLLTKDPKKRITCSEALSHKWFFSETGQKPTVDSKTLALLSSYKGISSLKKEAMNVLVRMVAQQELNNLREQFFIIDKDQTGMISMQELSE